ncbi:MAG: SPFH domain-containing protein [Rhodospirillaceae bacterium]
MLLTFTILAGIILLLVMGTIIVVPMREACVVERLGKFDVVLTPGAHLLFPFIDKVAYRHEMREQVIDVPPQSCITRDNILVQVDGIVYLKLLDPERASYGIGDYRLAAINLAQTTMRAEIGKLPLGNVFAERESLNGSIVREIDKASDPWGVKILRYEIRDITPTHDVIHTLEKQMEAERKRRADVTNAEAQREATINISEGERAAAINLSEGEKQRRINEAKGKAEAIGIVADATATGTRLIAEAIRRPGGDAAVWMKLVNQYIETLGRILAKADVTVAPVGVASLQGILQALTGGTIRAADATERKSST